MFKRFPLKPLDILILIITVGSTTIITLNLFAQDHKKPYALIEYEDQSWLYPLDSEKHLDIPGPLGITTIVIKDHEAYFEASPCRDKLCMLMGHVSKPGQWTACLPNKVFLRVIGGTEEQLDEVSH